MQSIVASACAVDAQFATVAVALSPDSDASSQASKQQQNNVRYGLFLLINESEHGRHWVRVEKVYKSRKQAAARANRISALYAEKAGFCVVRRVVRKPKFDVYDFDFATSRMKKLSTSISMAKFASQAPSLVVRNEEFQNGHALLLLLSKAGAS